MFYYYKKDKIQEGILFCVYQSETKLTQEKINEINKYQDNLLNNTIIYEGEIPFFGYPILSGNTIRPANDRELVELNKLKLGEGEILIGDNISKVPQPNWQYKWDYILFKWIPDEEKLEEGQYISEDKIITVPKLENALVQEWNKSNHTWEDKTTILDTAQAQYDEYKPFRYSFNINGFGRTRIEARVCKYDAGTKKNYNSIKKFYSFNRIFIN